MKNKGFSMVELIIVIAIMAVLAGFLAPMLVKYINKSRLSVDIDTGNAIAKAIMIAIADQDARDNAAFMEIHGKLIKWMEVILKKQSMKIYLRIK